DAALLQHALDVAEADHEIAQVVHHASGELSHRAQALQMQEVRLRAADLYQARVQLVRAFREQGDQALDGARLVDVLARLPHRLEDVVRLPRLLQEAEHPGAVDGGDESGGIGEAGEDDPGHVGLEIAKLLQQLDAGHFRHSPVGYDDVEGGGLGDLQRFVAGLRLVNAITRFEEVAQDGQVGL